MGAVEHKSLIRLQRNMRKRGEAARNTKGLMREFRTYTMERRVPSMFRNRGRVPGPWGVGYTRWAPNTDWVRRAKGHGRVFYNAGGTSGILDAYKFFWGQRGYSAKTTKAWAKLDNDHEAADYLEQGITGGKRIRPRHAEALAIPYAPGVTILRKWVRMGARKGRHIKGFARGDAKWLARKGMEEAMGSRI